MPPPASHVTEYRTISVDGLNVFYREAGPPDAPSVLLLHGFPSSSRMYSSLIPLLADRFHVVAPDYPGFGHSSNLGQSVFGRGRPLRRMLSIAFGTGREA